ncbi:MAG: hypothetical protein HY929_00215 [Euryarchaeota archaeon]|nr:hypothetical protein [Euryarchaeota archaeon]
MERAVKYTLTAKVEDEIELLKRHMLILKLVLDNQPIGIIKLSELTKLPQHRVRYSLRVLEHEGLIRPSPQGAILTEKASEFIKTSSETLEHLSETLSELKLLASNLKKK